MAKSRDNIEDGNVHGQASFDGVGVLLPREVEFYERPVKRFEDIDIDEIVSMGYQIFNADLKNGKTTGALGVIKEFNQMKGYTKAKQDSTATIRIINTPTVKDV